MDKAKELPIESIIYVSDEQFRPYILLKDIDDQPYWRPYGGESIENIRKFHEWELEAHKKFKDERRTAEEIDYLRNALMSISFVVNFFNLDTDIQQDFLGGVLDKTAFIWFCKDKKLDLKTFKPEEHADELQPYLSLAAFYITSFFDTIEQVTAQTLASANS